MFQFCSEAHSALAGVTTPCSYFRLDEAAEFHAYSKNLLIYMNLLSRHFATKCDFSATVFPVESAIVRPSKLGSHVRSRLSS